MSHLHKFKFKCETSGYLHFSLSKVIHRLSSNIHRFSVDFLLVLIECLKIKFWMYCVKYILLFMFYIHILLLLLLFSMTWSTSASVLYTKTRWLHFPISPSRLFTRMHAISLVWAIHNTRPILLVWAIQEVKINVL